jgi:hypothetical protein
MITSAPINSSIDFLILWKYWNQGTSIFLEYIHHDITFNLFLFRSLYVCIN